MNTKYPAASWRPLGTQTEPLITPRIIIFHTMSGYLAGTDTYFRHGNGAGYTGTESHFGVGGPWDGAALDGAVYQWQSIDRQADAQGPGNNIAISIETSDGGQHTRPWSPNQITALINLGTWICKQTGIPPTLVTTPTGTGIGYHSQYLTWNPNTHDCPGATRVRQLKDTIIPSIQKQLTTPHTPTTTGATMNQTDLNQIADTLMSANARYRVDQPVPPGQPRQLISPTTALTQILQRLDTIEKHLVSKG